jgi:hypothetical protein
MIAPRRICLAAIGMDLLTGCERNPVPGPYVRGPLDQEMAKARCRLMAESGEPVVAGFGPGFYMAVALEEGRKTVSLTHVCVRTAGAGRTESFPSASRGSGR